MKKITLVFATLIVLCFMADWVAAKPVVVIDHPVYTFETIPDGVRLDREFVIRNTGDTELIIENVLPP